MHSTDEFTVDYWSIVDNEDGFATLRKHTFEGPSGAGGTKWYEFAPHQMRDGTIVVIETGVITYFDERARSVFHSHLHEYDQPEQWKDHILDKGLSLVERGMVKTSHGEDEAV